MTQYGHAALPFTAFAIIPFDMTARNYLHEKWRHRSLRTKMTCLIISGSLVSFMTGASSGAVALASMIAFLLSGAIDSIVYQLLFDRTYRIKMNASNLYASIADSIAFPLIAFGSIDWYIAIEQSMAKFFGGLLWSAITIKLLFGKRDGISN